jgi:hypothetical protein
MKADFLPAAIAAFVHLSLALPTGNQAAIGPVPGESSYYSTYRGKEDAYPANAMKDAILPTTEGAAGPDDLLFQNLLSAEWAIYSFYQQGVEIFNTTAFIDAGFPNNTYDRIAEIRDNEAGHLAIFQAQISSNSVKPGACKYEYGFTDTTSYLAIQSLLEISSMAFLTGLVLQAELNVTKAALLAISETESRHNTWSLIDIWKADPFAGPSDTIFPYANEILDLTNMFIIPGSCPSNNPPYPYPSQHLPELSIVSNSTTGLPGSNITFKFEAQQPVFEDGKEYFSVAFHGLSNHSTPFDTKKNTTTIPEDIEPGKGMIMFVIADQEGAPTLESIVAGPAIRLNQTPNI